MEAIKCPNCGSEAVQQLTDEKYVCMACDVEFLVHNLSKEFRKTDKHITDVHADLKKDLNKIRDSVNKEDVREKKKYRFILQDAEDALKRGNYIQAYDEFKKYTEQVPDSYAGYYGMFRSLTNDTQNDRGQSVRREEEWNKLYDGFDVLKKALECEDCDKEKVLPEVLAYFKRSSNTAAGTAFIFNEWQNVKGKNKWTYDQIWINCAKYSEYSETERYRWTKGIWEDWQFADFKEYLRQKANGADGFRNLLSWRIDQIKGHIEQENRRIEQNKAFMVKRGKDNREKAKKEYDEIKQYNLMGSKGKWQWWFNNYTVPIVLGLALLVPSLVAGGLRCLLLPIELILIGIAISGLIKFKSIAVSDTFVYNENQDEFNMANEKNKRLIALLEDLERHEGFLKRFDGIDAITEEVMENIITNSYIQGSSAEETYRLMGSTEEEQYVCRGCGTPIEADAGFCAVCGSLIRKWDPLFDSYD